MTVRRRKFISNKKSIKAIFFLKGRSHGGKGGESYHKELLGGERLEIQQENLEEMEL